MKLDPCPHCGQEDFESKRHRGQHVRQCRAASSLPPEPPYSEADGTAATPIIDYPPTGDPSKMEWATRPIDVAIDPYEAKFSELEDRLGSQLQGALTNINSQIEQIPQMIDQSVATFLQAYIEKSQPAQQGNPSPDNPNPGAATNTGGSFLQRLNWERVLSFGLGEEKVGNLDPDKAVAKLLFGQKGITPEGLIGGKLREILGGKSVAKSSLSPEAAYSRGAGQALTSLRSKKIDSHFAALTMRARAARELTNPKLLAGKREHWQGQLDISEAHLEAEALARQAAVPKVEVVKPEGGA